MHPGRSERRPRGGRLAWLRCDGRPRRRGEHRQCLAWGFGRGDRVRGVGDSAIARARLAGASPIIAIDRDPKKLQWATELGATHTIDASEANPVEAVQELTGGFGADVVVDAVGRPETWKQALYARDLAGTVVLVAVPTSELTFEMPLIDFFSHGGALKSSWYGDACPSAIFRRSSSSTSRVACRWRSSSASASSWIRSRRRSRPCTAAKCCARWSSCKSKRRSGFQLRGTGSWSFACCFGWCR